MSGLIGFILSWKGNIIGVREDDEGGQEESVIDRLALLITKN